MNFNEYIENELKNQNIEPGKLAVIYKYLGDEEKATDLFKKAVSINAPASKYGDLDDKYKKNRSLLLSLGEWQLKKGVEYSLCHEYEKARQCFEWAAENCYEPDEDIKGEIKAKNFDKIATEFLWRGYALLMLGKVSESFKLLKEVPNYFDKEKLSGHQIWQVYEPNLVKVLLPLSEFKLSPSKDNKEKASKGLKDFINSFKEPRWKLEALLYYYHLKEMFPEVYGDNPKVVSEKKSEKFRSKTPANVTVEDVDRPGAVVVYDPTGYLDIFGSPKELVQFVEAVGKLGDYPLLSNLLDYYNVENNLGMDPAELEKECERLLGQTDDSWLIEKTDPLLDVAREAQEDEGENIVLYLDPDIPMTK